MKINKEEAVLLRSIVFSFLLKNLDYDTRSILQKLQNQLDDFIFHSKLKEDNVEKQQEDRDNDDNLKERIFEIDSSLSSTIFHELPPIFLESESERFYLELEEADCEDSINVLFNGEFKFEMVALRLEKEKLNFITSKDEIFSYEIVKLPKRWSKTFEFNKTYGIGVEKAD